MKGFLQHPTWVIVIVLFTQLLSSSHAQTSQSVQLWEQAIERKMQNGTFEGFQCFDDFETQKQLEKNGSPCLEANEGYGTPGWNPQSSPLTNNFDPACTVPNTPSNCNGGKYRIALRNVIFECSEWAGDNYLETGGGFRAMPDEDLTNKLAEVNKYFANANLEIVEVERVRINNCDMYDFYWNKFGKDPLDRMNDGIKDEQQLASFDEPNVINLYWVGGFNTNHGCCGILGYVDKPPSERDFGVMRYGVSINPSYLHHELSHYFGVYHTHWNLDEYNNVHGYPDGAFDNSDCLTTGDGICDTWPDPNFEAKCENCEGSHPQHCYKDDACGFDMDAFECEKGERLQIDPNTGVYIDQYTSTVLKQNFTTYNSRECRSTFTPCQYFKMNTIATSCRSHLSITDPNAYFYNVAEYQKEMNLGGEVPIFTAGKTYTTFDGTSYDLNCFNWYLNESDLIEEAVLNESGSFDPTAYLNGEGTYTFYLSEVNALNNPPAKIPVQLIVNAAMDDNTDGGDDTEDEDNDDDNNCAHPRSGRLLGQNHYELNGSELLYLETTEAFLGEGESLAWWITKNEPIIDRVNNQIELDQLLSTVLLNPENDGTHLAEEAIFEADKITTGLKIDCDILEDGFSYYATPLILKMDAVNVGQSNNCVGNFTTSHNQLNSGEVVSIATLKKGSVPCIEDHINYQIEVKVKGYIGKTEDFRLYIVPQTNTNVKLSIQSGGDGNYTFNKADLDNYNPNYQGLRIAVFEENGDAGANVELTVQLKSGGNTTNNTAIATYSDCLFGEAVSFECASTEAERIEGRTAQIKEQLTLYPSPTYENFIHLNYHSLQTATASIVIYGMNGQIMKQQQSYIQRGENNLTIDLTGFPSGVYVMKLMQGQQIKNAKFTVMR